MDADPGRVWWLYGPPCVGKSATAWELFTGVMDGQPRGYFDIDQVGMCYPGPSDDPGRHRLKVRAAGVVVRRFSAAGARTMVISGVLDDRSLTAVVDTLDPVQVSFCRLRVEPAELSRRLTTRYGPEDVARALIEAADWDQHESDHVVVDTGSGDPLDIAHQVATALQRSAPPTQTSHPQPASVTTPVPAEGGPGRAVLICGPAAVGKSTVGFGLFMSLLAGGRAAAYVDLEQLSFLADLPSGAPTVHHLVADGVAGLWREYQHDGAEDLVLTGSIQQLGDLQALRSALGSTPLLVCRLQAGREGLRERILDRTRGDGPRLAGDALRGLPVSQVEAVLDTSLAQQSHLERLDIADVVIDTDGETSDALTRALRDTFDQKITMVSPVQPTT